ncbi:phosphopentomutase [Faecalibaculum rodentium]|uniref:phosphopentomutase n=1 Tax=Faecalibaculum rodentium TaxID=1702221 RepID=UPI00256ED623|nr:phosphopentomutase [Faecalibaculum rodentium]
MTKRTGAYRRIFLVVADSFGAGGARDAAAFGDEGADTMGHIAQDTPGWKIPVLMKLGLGSLRPLAHQTPDPAPVGRYGFLNEASAGKDTMTGHWEMMGLKIDTPFQTFGHFPPALIEALERETGRRVIGNRPASGTQILEELAPEEIATGHMIIYTSADSVLQICGNEETFGLQELYRCCEIARRLTMKPEWKVGRVIARPYVGKKPGEFVRTANRRDYALKPFGRTVLDSLKDAGFEVISVGKIRDIFDGEGITEAIHSDSSVQGMEQTIDLTKRDFTGVVFTNLVDFDAKWGHRRNVAGYAREVEAFDERLGELMQDLRPDDLLLVTADHGNDPTWTGTDHTRERVPLLAWSPSMKQGGPLPEQDTFAAIGRLVAENFGVPVPEMTELKTQPAIEL